MFAGGIVPTIGSIFVGGCAFIYAVKRTKKRTYTIAAGTDYTDFDCVF